MLAVRQGLGLARRHARVGVDVVDDRRFDVFVPFRALVCFEAVSRHQHVVQHVVQHGGVG